MPTYVYRCDACGRPEYETEFSIGEARSLIPCACGSMMKLVIGRGVHIAAAALPNKNGKAAIVEADRKDAAFAKDGEAYKRMRARGLQPKHIDGAARVENEVDDQMDIDRERAFKLDPKRSRQSVRDSIVEGYETVAQLKADADA